jgi:hypothetical protein
MSSRGLGASARARMLVVAVLAAFAAATAPAAANNYTPGQGAVVSDSGFRPAANGYSFENYTNEGNPQNLEPVGMRLLFGPRVCQERSATGRCTLIPAAARWAKAQSDGMSGGHCEGMAVTASFFFAGIGDPPDPYGAPTVPGLQLSGNRDLQAYIAYGFVFQELPAVKTTKVNANPQAVLQALAANLPSREPMVLGIYQRGFKGGHAITPLAIEQRSETEFAILVYDNNFPNEVREVRVDLADGTWNYSGSTNPSEAAAVYEGDGSSRTLEVEFARNGLGTQPCFFCGSDVRADDRQEGDGSGQLIWTGPEGEGQHSEVSIVDEEGRRAGSIGEDGAPASEIPGVGLNVPKLGAGGGVPVWEKAPPPTLDVPDRLRFEVDLDGSELQAESREGFAFVRDGITFDVSGLEVEPGDDAGIEVDRQRITLPNDTDHEIEPTVTYADQDGRTGYEVELDTDGLDEGSALELVADAEDKQFKLEFAGEGNDAGEVRAVVRKLDKEGEVDRASTKTLELTDGEDGKVGYDGRDLRDGKLEFDEGRKK